MDDNNLPKGLFGLNKKDVESYIQSIKNDYEKELSEQSKRLQEMKNENIKLNEKVNTLMKERQQIEMSKQSISDVLIKAEEQAKQIVEDARAQAEKERQDVEVLIEEQKEKLIDAKIELAMLKDKATEIIEKFSGDLSNLQ
ncbi:MAG: hypothetical protein IKR04_05530 [Clostridia bacterium]|nr:hypothetical protein [Clostridia bacterium]